MKLTPLFLALGFLGIVQASVDAALVDDTLADGNSRNQNLAQNSLDIFDGRTGRTAVAADETASGAAAIICPAAHVVRECP
jgi:hypothetical protein